MKKLKKLVMAMAMIVAFAAVAPSFNIQTPFVDEVSAGTKTYSNILVGQSFTYSVTGTKIKSISFSKKGILKAKKNSKTKYTLKAKKAGSTTVTAKYTNGRSRKFKVNVSSVKSVKVTAVSMNSNGEVIFKLKNTGKCSFETYGFDYALCDSYGNILTTGTRTVSYLNAGSTAYVTAYVGTKYLGADLSKTVTAINGSKCYISFRYKYTKYTEKKDQVAVTCSHDATAKSTKVKLKNKTKKNVSAVIDVRYYKDGQLVYTYPSPFFLTSKKSETKTQTVPNSVDFDTVKYTLRAYTKSYISDY